MSVRYQTLRIVAAATSLVATAPIAAQPTRLPDLTSAVRLAVDRGEMLYIYDRAAWLGTDDFLGRHSDLTSLAGGYVVTSDQARTELVFYDKGKSKAVFRATYTGGKLTNNGPPAPNRTELTPLERQMVLAKEKALDAFIQAKVGLCAKANPNLAALPPERPEGPIIVYFMTPQTDLNAFPLGGHYSVEVRQDGTAGQVRHFTKGCIDMKLDDVPKGAKPIIFTITHLLDPTPTEIHVFTSLASKMPIMVATVPDGRLWAVEGNKIQSLPMPSQ